MIGRAQRASVRPRTDGVALLAAIMVGAAYTNLSHPPVAAAIRPARFLALFGGLAWSQRA
ncbi:MAG: hypothetical protein HY275_02775 [Gemmatimonadetes bacterium]|nr:hypothetical protein [Gemmatimonadota bacterium]